MLLERITLFQFQSNEQVNEREKNREVVVSIRDNGTGIEVSDVPLTEANSDNLGDLDSRNDKPPLE